MNVAPTPAASPPATGQALPWYYLGDVACLAGIQRRARPELVAKLIGASDEEFAACFAGDQPSTAAAEPAFVAAVRDVVNGARGTYAWGAWPAGLTVRFRKMLPYEFFLSHDQLVLPVPTRVQAAQEAAWLPRIAAATAGLGAITDPNGELGAGCVAGYTLMAVCEELVKTDVGRAFLEEYLETHPGDGRGALLAWSHTQSMFGGLDLPGSFVVHVEAQTPTTGTRLEVHPAHLALHLGTLEKVWSSRQVFFDKWPCGAFGMKASG